jgi:hypothetical protein
VSAPCFDWSLAGSSAYCCGQTCLTCPCANHHSTAASTVASAAQEPRVRSPLVLVQQRRRVRVAACMQGSKMVQRLVCCIRAWLPHLQQAGTLPCWICFFHRTCRSHAYPSTSSSLTFLRSMWTQGGRTWPAHRRSCQSLAGAPAADPLTLGTTTPCMCGPVANLVFPKSEELT